MSDIVVSNKLSLDSIQDNNFTVQRTKANKSWEVITVTVIWHPMRPLTDMPILYLLNLYTNIPTKTNNLQAIKFNCIFDVLRANISI